TEGHRSAKAAVASVADALTAHGFAAHAEASGGGLTLVAEHCPFGEAARMYPHVLCAVDTGMIRGMLEGLYGETQPILEQSRPGGGNRGGERGDLGRDRQGGLRGAPGDDRGRALECE